MSFADPAGLWLLSLAIPVLLLHVLRPRRERVEVSSTFLWDEAPSPVSAAVPWQRLRPSWLLLAQLLMVMLLAGVVARPVLRTDAVLAEHTVFIIDTSGSMGAADGDPDRLGSAFDEARSLRRQVPEGGIASVVVAAPRSRVLLSASDDIQAFDDALDRIELSTGTADFADAFLLAEGLETPGVPVGFALVSDGGLSIPDQRLIPPGTTFHGVGERSTNRSVSDLVVEPRGSGLHVIATVTNHGAERVQQPIRLDVDGVTVDETILSITAGNTSTWELDAPAGDRVDAFLESEDLLDADDHAYAVAARRRDLSVLLVGPEDPFLSRALAVIPAVTVDQSDQPVDGAGHDLVIFNGVAVPDDPGAPFLAIAPPDGAGPVTVTDTATAPAITLVDTERAVLAGIDLSEVVITESQQLDAGGARVLVAAPGTPLLVEGTTGVRPFLYLGFRIGDSNLPLQVGFPILVDRIVGELAGAALPPVGLTVGNQLPVRADETMTVIAPGGQEIVVPPGTPAPRTDRAGFWTIRDADGDESTVAVNVDSVESNVDPVPALPTELREVQPGEDRPRGERSLTHWLLWPLLVLLVMEFLLARRRVGVSRGQWRVAVGARAAIAVLLIAALVGIDIERAAGDVATVFLIDGSDSVSTGGRADAIAWVQDALADQPEGSRSAVALFGADARLELSLQRDAALGVPAVQIDASGTDAERALRLAGAVLPTDARRRIVLLSDGRLTAGDAESEAAILGAEGVQVDVVTAGRAVGLDVAVADLLTPATVREGEQYTIEATLAASGPATVVVSLIEEASVIEERAVEVDTGLTTVAFDRIAGDAELRRHHVQVRAAGDAIVQNDQAFGAVRIQGPASVLLVEGADGSGDSLEAALEAGGIEVDITSPAVIPPLDEISLYSAIVLVDVAERDLVEAHLEILRTAVRDLGRGLVVLGGDRSYGLGGYLDSELEELLPVISEILDPERRQTVAEVLAIDTSGSMGNCHCNEGAQPGIGGMQIDGGVNKTDISRSGAARAIDALSESDEVGVLAFNSSANWIIELQKLPSEEVVSAGLRSLFPSGGTNVTTSLSTAAEALRGSRASLKHIIFFSDGFTDISNLATLADEAEALAAEGITVSVISTGEGAAPQLEEIALSGQGRFYAGRDLQQIPELIMEEAVIASRDFITEGEFFPEIAVSADVIAALSSSPPLLGYVGTTAKPTASTLLRIGPDRDPLLASWQVGIGRATAWTSDASDRWSQLWADWDGYTDFWTKVVKDTFPAGEGEGAATVQVAGDRLDITLEGVAPFPDGAGAIARVTPPDGATFEVPLQRTAGSRFEAEMTVDQSGTFAVGAAVDADGSTLLSVSAIASSSFAPEYLPGDPEPAVLTRLSELSGGRGEISPAMAFERADLDSGVRRLDLESWLLVIAALLWPLAVALSRLSLRTAAVTSRISDAGRGVVSRVPRLPGRPASPDRPPPQPRETREPEPISETLDQLLRRKRGGPRPPE